MKRLLNVLLALAFLFPASGKATAVSWPTLADQLRADRVTPRSALEALIAANQDFSLLRPGELKDKIRIPLWLRVYWRRAHPEMVYSAADPTGGYPFVLKEVREWMVSHQNLVPGPPEKDVADADENEVAPPVQKVMIAGEKRISGVQTAPRSESDIRVNYWDPMKIISASNNISGSGSQAQFYSTDGGATWGQTSLPLQPADAFHSDPTVEWTSDGTAWATTIGISGSVFHMRAYKSIDNGATWTFDATFSGAQTSTDKQIIWVDHSATSPFKDNLYAIWHNGLPAFMNRRTGPAGSWQTAVQVSGAESSGTAIGADVKTNAFGDVFGFWPATGSSRIFVVKSTNGGVSYGTPVQVATTFGSFDVGVPAMNDRRFLIYVSGGAYRTASKDLVYAAWSDLASACTEPGSNVASACKSRVWFSRSTNGGGSWSAPVMINNQASLNDQFNQWLVVDEVTGALEIVYYDTVADAGRKKVDIWHQSSFDDGVTWLPAAKVTSAQTDETAAGADNMNGNQFGDYNSLSGIAGQFFPSWTDRRSGGREEIWTAKVTDAACTPPGAPAIGTATVTAPNQVQVAWANGSPASTTFNVYRALGTCASPGTFSRIASSVAGSPYTDGAVSGTVTYAYQVKGLDATGVCESSPSGCVQATATGACTLPPSFAGLTSVSNPGTATCGLTLAWAAAAPACAGPVTYNVYRSTTPGFVPAPANRLAAGVTGTGYTDSSATLVSGVTYYYAVRAVDASNGIEDANSVIKSAAPTGTATSTLSETFEGAGGFDNPGWSHSVLAGTTDWAPSTARSQSPTHSWFSASEADPSERVLVTPAFTAQASSTLSFWHTFAFENPTTCYDAGTLEISTNGGSTWSVVPAAAFTAGGFNGTVNNTSSNPLANSRAWCGGSIGALTQVNVNLSSFAGSTSTRLRWHEGDDGSVVATGWYVDSVTLSNVGVCTPSVPVQHGFFTVVPCRVVDTRNAAGPNGGSSLQPSADRTFVVTGGACGIPSSAKALAVNVTVVGPSATGLLNLFAADQSAPATSVISFPAGIAARANNAIVGLPLDGSGGIKVMNSSTGTVQFLLDVVGYFQ